MDIKLDEVDISIFVPVERLHLLIGRELTHTHMCSDEIRANDSKAYNQAIERSLFSYFPKKIKSIPESLGAYRFSSEFYFHVELYLKELGLETPPSEQVCFEGELDGEWCYSLHLANTLNEELFIADIAFQNPLFPNKMGHTEREYKGLGNGIFDFTLKNIYGYAAQSGYKRVGLLASNTVNMEIFLRRGFVIEDNILGKLARQYKQGYPMVNVTL